jgi:rhamnogalacturonan endolyase
MLMKFSRLLQLLAVLVMLSIRAHAAFGLSTNSTYYTVDSGAGLVFKVSRSDGSITSILWNGTELNDQTKSSHIASGLGSTGTTVSATADSSTVMITIQTDSTNGVVADFTQYYVVRNGINSIYMATFPMNEPNVGEMRWITRLQSALFTSLPAESDLTGTTGAIESSDVFGMADGTTRSKYYGRDRAKELGIRGITGPGRGVFMYYGTRESASGGPFYRDIQNQTAEVYNYMNSGHTQTEAYRLGVLHGPYVLMFTDGSTPATPDVSFMSTLGLTGYVGASGRGSVSIAGITGRDTNFDYTVGFSNATAQYWADAALSDGSALCQGMKPGTYTMTIYKGELAVASSSVTVTAGQTTPLSAISLSADPSRQAVLWRVGKWDGTPLEFRNGSNIRNMHPSDVRQSSWVPGTYTIGSSSLADFPACQWMGINGTQSISFNLTSAQITGYTVRIGLTCVYAGGRPKVSVNSWTPSSNPPASSQPDSRSMTVGTYRGINVTYTVNVPSSALVVGTNTLNLNVISGSGGTAYLSPGYGIDCVDIYPTSSSTLLDVPAQPSGITVTPSASPRSIGISWSAVSGATTYEISRATTLAGPYTVVASALTATTWTDTDVAAAGPYYYRLCAVNDAGKSVPASLVLDPSGPARTAGALTWTGAASATCDNSSLNWSSASGTTYFYFPSDTLRFDDTSSVTAVTISGALAPSSVTVDSTQNYSFSGTGAFTGSTTLTKSGSGTLTLNNVNTLTGQVTVNAGTLALGSNAQIGSTPVLLASGATFRMASSGSNFPNNTLQVVSGASATFSSASLSNAFSGAISGAADSVLNLSGPISLNASGSAQFSSFPGTVNVASGSQLRFSSTSGANGNGGSATAFVIDGSLNSRNSSGSGGIVLGSLAGSGSLTGQTNTPAGSTTFFIGARGGDTVFSGSIQNSTNGTVALTKQGSGSLTLSGVSSYTGATAVAAGSLIITGSLGNTAVSVSSAATVGGTGTLAGNLTLSSGARLALGVGSAATRGLSVSGTSTLNGFITVVPTMLGGSLAPGTYTLLSYTGTLGGSPSFSWTDTTGAGYTATFSTATAGQVKITLTAPLTAQQTWRQSYFGYTANTGYAADDEDPDGDGIPNLLEYAFGNSPLAPNAAPTRLVTSSGYLQISFTRIADPTLQYAVQASSNLVTWSDIWTSTGSANLAGQVSVLDDVPLAAANRRFLRLKVTIP